MKLTSGTVILNSDDAISKRSTVYLSTNKMPALIKTAIITWRFRFDLSYDEAILSPKLYVENEEITINMR